ncbi:hypothetical protein ACLB1T_11165 [Escherichia coli]
MNCAGRLSGMAQWEGEPCILGRENNLMLLEYAGERMLCRIVAEHRRLPGDRNCSGTNGEAVCRI